MPRPRLANLQSHAEGPAPLVFSETASPGGHAVALAGELDLASAAQFGVRLEAIVREEPGTLVLDLRALRFIDSAGLHLLLNAQRRLTRQGRRLQVICADGPVLRAIQLARLAETLNVSLDR